MKRVALVPLLALALAVAGCGGSKSAGGCTHVDAPKPRTPDRLPKPAPIDAARRWTLAFETSCGTFVVRLEPRIAPHATASLVALARRHYFDGTIFHRIVPGFVIQGGDPTQTGGGGPGYTTVDTPGPATAYRKGVVAMAKTATEPRGAAGSQFFVMTADSPGLPPDYAVVGRVVSGQSVVDAIGRLGDPNDPNGTPTQTVVIDRVSVTSS